MVSIILTGSNRFEEKSKKGAEENQFRAREKTKASRRIRAYPTKEDGRVERKRVVLKELLIVLGGWLDFYYTGSVVQYGRTGSDAVKEGRASE